MLINNWENPILAIAKPPNGEAEDPKFKRGELCDCPDYVFCTHRANYIKRQFRAVLRYELGEKGMELVQKIAPANNLSRVQGKSQEFLDGYNAAFKAAQEIEP